MSTRAQAPRTESDQTLYPVFLKMAGKTCLVIGGGTVAVRKAEGLLACGAAITVVSPGAHERIKQLAQQGRIRWVARTVTNEDFDGVFMTFAATDDEDENKKIAALCGRRDVLVNVADEPRLCDFFVPAVARRKSLTVAVSTGGKSPLYARRLRTELAQQLTHAHGEFVDLLGQQRESVIRKVADSARRQEIFRLLVDSDILELLRQGKRADVQKRIQQCISSLPD